ncbi:MAG: cytochrome c oxidase accessory protein CcoG [Cellvibrionaceae bacterium]
MSDRIEAINVESLSDNTSSVEYVDSYVSSKVYTRRIQGYFQRLRRRVAIPLLLLFVALPWFSIEGRPAMYFDLGAQKFHVLWITFWPQDGILLAWLLIIAAFLLFAVTVWIGRVWCGFSCPQTIWTQMFIWIEDFCEGDRNRRIKLDEAPWGVEKILRKSSKQSLWALASLVTGFSFIAYFYGPYELLHDTLWLEASLETYFWLSCFSLMTYLNAGYLREQVCKYMCPYSRIQSVMYDQDTLVVAYDHARGEGAAGRGNSAAKSAQGDCVDCSWCVQVCPVDIDIRDGLQPECIACGLCIDACDQVMDKLQRPRGLIRFESERVLGSAFSRLARPRMIGYSLALTLMIGVFAQTLLDRVPLGVDVIRDRGTHLYRERNGAVENVYTVKINNMETQINRVRLSIDEGAPYRLRGLKVIELEPGEVLTIPVRISAEKSQLLQSRSTIHLAAEIIGRPDTKTRQKTRFMAPAIKRSLASL